MTIWPAEVKDLKNIYESIRGKLPDLENEQVKPVLSNLATIVRWYLNYRNLKADNTVSHRTSIKYFSSQKYQKTKKKGVLISTALVIVAIAISTLVLFNLIEFGQSLKGKPIESLVILPFDNLTGDTEMETQIAGFHSMLISEMQQ